MSRENRPQDRREQHKAVMAAMNARDFDLVDDLADGNLEAWEFRSVFGPAEGEEAYTGIDGFRKWAKGVDATWEDFHQEVVDFREVGDNRAVAVIRVTGRARASGVPLDTRVGQVMTYHPDGSGGRVDVYTDPREALEAVGLRE